MSQTLDALQSLMERLSARNPDLAVEFFPDDPDAYRLNHPVGALLVSYPGAAFGVPRDTAIMVQDRDVRFAVTLVFRQLNGREGAVDRLDRLREHLVGWTPAHCTKTRAVREQFLQQKQGVWYYVALFEASTLQVEAAEDPAGPPAKDIRFISAEAP